MRRTPRWLSRLLHWVLDNVSHLAAEGPNTAWYAAQGKPSAETVLEHGLA